MKPFARLEFINGNAYFWSGFEDLDGGTKITNLCDSYVWRLPIGIDSREP